MSESVVRELVSWVALDEETSQRINSAGPRFEIAVHLKLQPVFRVLENVNVRLDIAGRLRALQFFRYDAISEFRFHRDSRRDITMHEMIEEILGLALFPLFGMNGERLLSERIEIALTQLCEFHLGQIVRLDGRRIFCRR